MICLTYLYPHIPLGSCELARILASSYLHVRVHLLVSSHSYILKSSGSCALTCIPVSSYLQVRVGLLVTSHPRILLSIGSCTLCACWYLRILMSSGSSARICFGNWNQIKTMVLTKKRPSRKQVMAQKNLLQNSTFTIKIA